MNESRRRVASLIRNHNHGDGSQDPDLAVRIRRAIYVELTRTVRSADLAAAALRKQSKLADGIRQDAGWAFVGIAALNGVENDTVHDARSRDAIGLISESLPETSDEIVPGDFEKRPAILEVDSPSITIGPAMQLLHEISTHHRLYTLAVERKDMGAAQNLRVAIHDRLNTIEQITATRFLALDGAGLSDIANALVADWKWATVAKKALSKTLHREGFQERSLEPLLDAEVLPVTEAKEIKAIEGGLWSARVAQNSNNAARNSSTTKAWTSLLCGFRPGTIHVTVRQDTILRPAGHGGALGMFEYNEYGMLCSITTSDGKPFTPMVHIRHQHCPKCKRLTTEDCQECKVSRVTASRAHIPLSLIPEIAEADDVGIFAGESLLVGALLETLKIGDREGEAVRLHLPKAESRRLREASRIDPDKILIQRMHDDYGTEWVNFATVKISARRVFVYLPAIIQTNFGDAEFCFGQWLDFENIQLPNPAEQCRFHVGDEVIVEPEMCHIGDTINWTGRKPKTIQWGVLKPVRSKHEPCVGVVVRRSVSRTLQEAPKYDVRVGGVVLLNQPETALRPKDEHGLNNADFRPRGMGAFYNVCDTEAYTASRRHEHVRLR